MVGIPPRDETLNRLHDIVFDKIMSVLRGPEAKPFDLFSDYLDRFNRELDAPLRLAANVPTDTNLVINSNKIIAGDGGGKTTPPIDDVLNEYDETMIDFSDGSIVGGTVTSEGNAFAFPVVTVGEFVRLALVYQSANNRVDTIFSDAEAVSGNLANPGDLFSALDGLPIGYVDLESNGVSSFQSIGSVSGLIENEVNGLPMINRFSVGGGLGGGALNDFKIKQITGSNALIGKGFQTLIGKQIIVTGTGTASTDLPDDVTVNLTTILGSAPSADTTYWLYVDKDMIEQPFTLTDNDRPVIRINNESDFALLTTDPENTNQLRYLPVGFIHTADDASWDGSESIFGTHPVLREHLDNRFFAGVEQATDEIDSASGSISFAHNLSGKPQIIEMTYFDGTSEIAVDESSHILDITDTIIEYSSLGLIFGSGEELRLKAYYVSGPGQNISMVQTQPEFGWYTDTLVTSVAHNLNDAMDIKGMSLIEHDVIADEYRLLPNTMLVEKFDDTTIYFDWTGLGPSASLRYKLVAGGRALPSSVPIQFGGCNKFVGLGPGSFPTLAAALADAQSGDSILISKSYSISAEETISVDDIKIKFMPGIEITITDGTVGWRVTGDRVDIEGLAMSVTKSGTLTDALRVEGNDGNVRDAKIRTNDAGATLTNAYTIASGALRALIWGSARADLGTITNGLNDSGTTSDASVRF